MLEVRNLKAGYSGKTILNQVNLTVPEGKVTAILGPNGCGKSTLLKTICGILTAQSGEVLLDGTDILGLNPKLLAQKVAYLAQDRRIPDITVERLVLHGRFPYLGYPRRYRKEDFDATRTAMEKMGVAGLADTLVQQLSGGQRQKAYIAMALAQDTPVVLLDEPTAYLDIAHQLQMMQQARLLAQQGKTVLMIIHDLPHAMQTADKLILMNEGEIAAQGTPEEIFASAMVDRIFNIKLDRVKTDSGWRYYCEEVCV